MTETVPAEKRALRGVLQARLLAVPAAVRAAEGARVVARLLERPEWRRAHRVMLFAPMPVELDVWPLAELALQEGRVLALPRYDSAGREYHAAEVSDLERDLVRGSFGIREPRPECAAYPLNRLDFVLVPGLGFDAGGRRLGRGKGFYDRLLASVRGTACGVAMDWQVMPAIPAEPHDRRVDCILTPSRWVTVERRAAEQ